MNKICNFSEEIQCRQCRTMINQGLMHIVNKKLTYWFCGIECFNEEYGIIS